MATANALFRAKARAEVKTTTPANVNIGNTFSYTINGKTVTVTATAATVANVTGLAAAALAAVTEAEFTEITWTDSTTCVTATSAAGVPFTLTSAASGGTATNVTATTTAATGPTFWDDINNWDTGAVPGNSDTANVNLALGSFTDGFAQSAVTLAALNVFSPSTTQNTLGRPKLNAGGYTEYRARDLAIGATACRIDAESPLVSVNFGSVQNATEVLRTGTSNDTGVPAVLIQGTSAANTIDVVTGTVGLAYFDGESYNASSLTSGAGANVTTGTGAVIADTVSSGTIKFQGTGTNFETEDGIAEILGTPGFSTLVCSGGTTIGRFSGTIADVVVGPGTLDCSIDNTSRTFTSCSLDVGANIVDPNETIIYTNGIEKEAGVSTLTAA